MNNKRFLNLKNISLIIIIILFGIFSYHFIWLSTNNALENKVIYNSDSDIQYKVYLKENNFFEDPYLGMNKTYISSLIDYIDVDFNYNLKFDNIVSGEYIYYVNGTIYANKDSSGNGDYWSKSYVLSEPTVINYDNVKGFELNKNVKLDYQQYNDILRSFKTTYGLLVDGNFKVELVVESTSKTDILASDISIKSDSSLNIPLTQQVLDLSIDLKKDKNNDEIVEKVKIKDLPHTLILCIGILVGLLSLFFLILLIKNTVMLYLSEGKYEKALKKILNTYDSIIVNVNKIPDYKDYQVISVNDFSELIDAHGEIRKPINFIEEDEGYKSRFVLASENIIWEYVLENSEKKKKKRIKNNSKKEKGKR